MAIRPGIAGCGHILANPPRFRNSPAEGNRAESPGRAGRRGPEGEADRHPEARRAKVDSLSKNPDEDDEDRGTGVSVEATRLRPPAFAW